MSANYINGNQLIINGMMNATFLTDKVLTDLLHTLFGIRSKTSWNEFATNSKKLSFATPEPLLNTIKFCIVDDQEDVSRSHFEHFLKWFKPFENLFIGSELEGAQAHDSFSLDELLDIVGQRWFFGFVNAVKTKEILINMPIGTYVIRFSSCPRSYTVCATYITKDGKRDVGNWRIESSSTKGKHFYKFGSKTYETLTDFVTKHCQGGDSLPLEHGVCKLTGAADRNVYNITVSTCSLAPPKAQPVAESPPDNIKHMVHQLLKEKDLLEQLVRKGEQELNECKAKLKKKKDMINEMKNQIAEDKKRWEVEMEQRKVQANGQLETPLYKWLQEIGLERYYSKFIEEEIDMGSLKFVRPEDVERMGIKPVPARKLLAEISKL